VNYKIISILFLAFFRVISVYAQELDGSVANDERFSVHAQTTVICQYKPAFSAPYSGTHSLLPGKETRTSITSTLFAGARLWKNSSIFFNPEIAGGSGLSQAAGIADAPNGETFRVGSADPKIYLARLFFRQVFSLNNKYYNLQESDFNQLAGKSPEKFIAVTIGKIGVADYFDNNKFSHNPRTQFMSWGLMDNGAWDYPANTRGYTPSFVLEYVSTRHELRYGISLVPKQANGNDMNWNVKKANSSSLEYTYKYNIKKKPGAIRFLTFFTDANMGNYRKSIALNPDAPVIEDTRKYGRKKFGFVINAEQNITDDLGCFLRAGWNDGRNETWAFTEIDHSLSFGLSSNGKKWRRANDNLGIAYVISGISKQHREYLAAGGKGFMLGDGNLNYASENLAEFYYSAAILNQNIFITGAYQFLLNPGYNKDRQGPVNIFSIRIHARI
jgi:high affinity Mn2+ porin